MNAIGIRDLKNNLSRYLRQVKTGERLLVTERGRTIAVISPPPLTPTDERVEAMIRKGIIRWGGGKPRGSARPAKIKGPSVAQAVIEDRR